MAETERAPGFQHEIEGCPVAGDEQHERAGFYALYRACKIADGLHGLPVHLLNDIPTWSPAVSAVLPGSTSTTTAPW
jgi:hypothetical protein